MIVVIQANTASGADASLGPQIQHGDEEVDRGHQRGEADDLEPEGPIVHRRARGVEGPALG